MSGALILIALAAQTEATLEARSRRAGGQFELLLSARAMSVPEGSSACLRFRRLANRVDWSTRRIATEPLDRAWMRSAPVERGAIHLREPFLSPGELEVHLSIACPGAEQEVLLSTDVFRIGTVPERLAALETDAGKAGRLIAGARGVLDDLVGAKGHALERRIQKLRAAGRDESARTVLTGTMDLLDRFFIDLEAACGSEPAGKGGAPLLSAVTGEPFAVDSACGVLGRIEEISRRERRLVVAREAIFLSREITRLAHSGDPRKWARAESALERSLQAVEKIRDRRWDDLTAYLADLEMAFTLAPTILECPSSVATEWEKIRSNLAKGGAELEESQRKGD